MTNIYGALPVFHRRFANSRLYFVFTTILTQGIGHRDCNNSPGSLTLMRNPRACQLLSPRANTPGLRTPLCSRYTDRCGATWRCSGSAVKAMAPLNHSCENKRLSARHQLCLRSGRVWDERKKWSLKLSEFVNDKRIK